MSVKSKVKRLNKQIEELKKENILQEHIISQLETYKNRKSKNEEILENIVKFALTNHIGNLRGGMAVDWDSIDKLKDLRLDIEKNPMEHAYFIRVTY